MNWSEMTEEELKQLQQKNNPMNEPTGHFTGRCAKCGSKDLWDDATAYGCNVCKAIFFTGDILPRVICNHCGVCFEVGETHTCLSP